MHQKIMVAAVLMVVWAAMVFKGIVPADTFASTLRDLVLGLGLYHTALKNPKE